MGAFLPILQPTAMHIVAEAGMAKQRQKKGLKVKCSTS
jgi:hypothetical protein